MRRAACLAVRRPLMVCRATGVTGCLLGRTHCRRSGSSGASARSFFSFVPGFEGLISIRSSVTSRPMSFYIALFVWLLIAALLTIGVVMATKGAFLVLAIGTIAFVGAFIKWGCLTH